MNRDPIAELRKRRMVEVLTEVATGVRSLEWFEGAIQPEDERTAWATRQLLKMGFIKMVEGYRDTQGLPFCLTDLGGTFLEGVVARIGTKGIGGVINIDWTRINEIEFPSTGSE